MENKIYISNWAKEGALTPLTKFLIDNFVRTTRAYSPGTEIVFITDTVTESEVSNYVRQNTTIEIILDDYQYVRESYEWPLVKLMAIKTIQEDNLLHVDYDIVFKGDWFEVLTLFKNSEFDVVYQKEEELHNHGFYPIYLKNHPEVASLYKNTRKRVAYNAGITYVKNSNNLHLINSDYFSQTPTDYTAMEQIKTPLTFISQGLKIGTLTRMLSGLAQDKTYSLLVIPGYDFKKLSVSGVFIPPIGFYHFLSDLKKFEGATEIIMQLTELDYPENYLEQFNSNN